METKVANLPLMDMTRAKTDREAFAKDLVKVTSTIGFLLLENVEGVDPDGLMGACKWFFTQPLEKKFEVTRKRWNKSCKNVYRGYFPTGEDPNNSSHREAFECGVTLPLDDPDVLNGNRLYEKPPVADRRRHSIQENCNILFQSDAPSSCRLDPSPGSWFGF